MDLCVCGNINEDLIMEVGSFPTFHEKVRATALHRACGGSAANTAWWLASLGNKVRMVGCVGNDAAGERSVQDLKDAGVDTSGVSRSSKATGLAVVMSDGHDKRMVKYDGANRDMALSSSLHGCRHVHLSSIREGVAQQCIEQATAMGASVSWDPSELVHAELLCHVDILFVNEDDYKRSSKLLSETSVPVTVVTKNGGGCRINDTIDIPTIQAPVVDTTGAGDAFDAGFLHAWLSGASLEHCGRYAVACSYFNIGTFGSREGYTSRKDIERLIEKAY